MSYLEIGGQRRIIPSGDVTIGSDPSSQVALTGPGIASKHAVIRNGADGQVAIRKVSDQVEVLINGVRLGPQPTPLLHGDKVQIGNTELLFVDERRSGSTHLVKAVNPDSLAQAAAKGKKSGAPTGTTGGRLVSLTDGREYAITGQSLVMGRDAGCDVVLTGKSVSRRHAEIMATPKGYVLIDSSTNGAFVNGERVQGQRLLGRADVIKLGEDEFRFYADAAQAAAPPPPPPPPPPAPPTMPATPAPLPPPTSATAGRLANTLFGFKAPLPPPGFPPKAAAPSEPPKPAAPPRPSTPGPLATLVVRSGELKGARYPIKVPVVNVGRADYNDIVIQDESVSTVHAKLQRREGVWVVVDLDSTNGTFVDGEQIDGEAPIAPGALLRFGEVGVMFESTDDTVDPAKGSSTKMLKAVKFPLPPPKSGPA